MLHKKKQKNRTPCHLSNVKSKKYKLFNNCVIRYNTDQFSARCQLSGGQKINSHKILQCLVKNTLTWEVHEEEHATQRDKETHKNNVHALKGDNVRYRGHVCTSVTYICHGTTRDVSHSPLCARREELSFHWTRAVLMVGDRVTHSTFKKRLFYSAPCGTVKISGYKKHHLCKTRSEKGVIQRTAQVWHPLLHVSHLIWSLSYMMGSKQILLSGGWCKHVEKGLGPGEPSPYRRGSCHMPEWGWEQRGGTKPAFVVWCRPKIGERGADLCAENLDQRVCLISCS